MDDLGTGNSENKTLATHSAANFDERQRCKSSDMLWLLVQQPIGRSPFELCTETFVEPVRIHLFCLHWNT